MGLFEKKSSLETSHLSALQDKMGYRFEHPELLLQALTHPSYGYEKRSRFEDNQRLEFLGDAVLQLVITEKLYLSFPEEPEGDLTKLRSQLVNRTQMHQLAITLNIGELLLIGKGEEKNGGRSRPSNLADAMEAILGALYRDGGYEAARTVIGKLLDSAIRAQKSHPFSDNPKGDLQEKLQAVAGESPQYVCLSEEGPSHARQYTIQVSWKGKILATGIGTSKKQAEMNAAKEALQQIDDTEIQSLTEVAPPTQNID
ncbi:MAG: ribonuclease III [Verrucomicrobiota bacterium]